MVSTYLTHHGLDKRIEQFVTNIEAPSPPGGLAIETDFRPILVNLNQRGIGVTIKGQAGLAPAHIVNITWEQPYLRAFACLGYRTLPVLNNTSTHLGLNRLGWNKI